MDLKKVFIAKGMRGNGLGRRNVSNAGAEAHRSGCKVRQLEAGISQKAAATL